MRYGVVADVHANLPALEMALDVLAEHEVDRIVCAGDVVGYGPHPNECVVEIAERGIDCVAGNHDLIAIGKLGFERTDGLARATLEWTRAALGDEARKFLERLPPQVETGELTVAHGSLDDPTEYVRTDAAAAAQLAEVGTPLLVLGHTHVASAWGSERGRLLSGRSGSVELLPGERHLLNPGSVGQARERRPVARLLVVDTDAGSARFIATGYAHRRTRRALVEAGLPVAAYHRKPTWRGRASRVKAALRR